MNAPTFAHMVIGVALLVLGFLLVRRRRHTGIAWALCLLGVASGAIGLAVGVFHFHS